MTLSVKKNICTQAVFPPLISTREGLSTSTFRVVRHHFDFTTVDASTPNQAAAVAAAAAASAVSTVDNVNYPGNKSRVSTRCRKFDGKDLTIDDIIAIGNRFGETGSPQREVARTDTTRQLSDQNTLKTETFVKVKHERRACSRDYQITVAYWKEVFRQTLFRVFLRVTCSYFGKFPYIARQRSLLKKKLNQRPLVFVAFLTVGKTTLSKKYSQKVF